MNKLERSIKIAERLGVSPEKKYTHYAFIYEGNKLVSIGTNNPIKTSPKVLFLAKKYNLEKWKKYPLLHAEIDAIIRARRKLGRDHVIVCVRLNKFGPAYSKPCANCMQIIRSIGMEVLWTE